MKPDFCSELLRSVLYVPGSNPKTLAKAPILGADALILDLEDSVAPEAKESARVHVLDTLQKTAASNAFLRVVRINGTGSDLWQEDLRVVLPGRPDAIAISKTESAADLDGPARLLEQLAGEAGGMVPLWAMIESPMGVLNALEIARHPLVSVVAMGTSDLARAMHLPPQPDRIGLRHALGQTILAARAAGVAVLDGVFLNLRDPDGFLAECQDGARLGFDGKTVIHPAQIEPANRVFLPALEEVERARGILDAWRAARERGEEICVLDGRLVERLHADQAARLLAKWELAHQESA
ncbi:MAG: CoA ester lyase [Magnetococcales bacterium]|nr:CoA ester lyase [Magnetococcales bacterium]